MENILPCSIHLPKVIASTFNNELHVELGSAAVHSPREMQTAAIEYVEAGLAIVAAPIRTKGPTERGWNTLEKAIVTCDKAGHVSGNIGLAHAHCPSGPTCAIDLDQLDKAKSWLYSHRINLDAMMQANDAVLILSGKVNSAKIIYRLPSDTTPLVTKTIKDEQNKIVIEFRCATASGLTVQDILPPSIHPSGTNYRWAGHGNWRDLPVLPPSLFALWRSIIEASNKLPIAQGATLLATDEVALTEEQWHDLSSALLSIPADDYDLWIRMGQALKGTGKRGRKLWMDWSATCSALFEENEAAYKWDTFNPTTISYKSVFAEAQNRGWKNPATTRTSTSSIGLIPDLPTGEWPEAQRLPPPLKPVPVFDVDVLPDAIRPWAVDCAFRFQAPVEYFIMPLLATAGLILGNRVGIQPKQNDTAWAVFPILWGAVVGNPGSLKTPTLNEALRPVRHLEAEAMKVFRTEMAKYEQANVQYQQLTSSKTKKANQTAPTPVAPQKPALKRYTVHDTTYQKLGEILEQNPNGVIAIADELTGLLQSLNAQGQEAARGFFLAGWGGNSSYSFDRIGRGTVTLSRFALSVFGGFQPDKIKTYVRGASAGSTDNDGLLQRFQLLAWPDEQKEWHFVDQAPDKAAEQAMHAAILRLEDVGKRNVSGAVRQPDGTMIFRFAEDAQTFFNQWYQKNERLIRNDDLDPAQCSHFAKYRSLLPALALLFHLIDSHEGPVCMACVQRAFGMAVFLKKHAERVYGSVQGGDYAGVRNLAKRLLDGRLQGDFTARDIYVKGWSGLKDRDDVHRAINALVEHGWLMEHSSNTGGRPTSRYHINPGIGEDLL